MDDFIENTSSRKISFYQIIYQIHLLIVGTAENRTFIPKLNLTRNS